MTRECSQGKLGREGGEGEGATRTRGVLLVVVLSVLRSVFRLVLFYMGVTGAELLEVDITRSVMQ